MHRSNELYTCARLKYLPCCIAHDVYVCVCSWGTFFYFFVGTQQVCDTFGTVLSSMYELHLFRAHVAVGGMCGTRLGRVLR